MRSVAAGNRQYDSPVKMNCRETAFEEAYTKVGVKPDRADSASS